MKLTQILCCVYILGTFASCQAEEDSFRKEEVLDINDIKDIIAFIQALDDPNLGRRIPRTVPLGLNLSRNIDE